MSTPIAVNERNRLVTEVIGLALQFGSMLVSWWRKHPSDPDVLRVFGYLALIGAVAYVLAAGRAWLMYGHTPSGFLSFAALSGLFVCGGTIRLKKSASIIFGLFWALTGVALGILTVRDEPTIAAFILAVGWAAILSLPFIFVVRAWNVLR